MENNTKKETNAKKLFAPYADESEKMTAEEVEKFMRDLPLILEELKKKGKEE